MTIHRRFNLNQRTPLTIIYMTGYESSNADLSQINDSSFASRNSTTNPHLLETVGGSRCYTIGGGAAGSFTHTFTPVSEAIAFFAFRNNFVRNTTNNENIFYFGRAGGNEYGFGLGTSLASLSFWRGATSLGQTTGFYNVSAEWSWWSFRLLIRNSGGIAQVRNTHYENLVLDFSGDTLTTDTTIDNFYVDTSVLSSLDSTVDDLIICARTIYYTGGTGGTGVPVVGNTLTTGGNTCRIDNYYDDGAGTGVLFISGLSGSFAASDIISDGSGWTATAQNAMADNKASLWIPESVIVQKLPTSDVTSTWSSTGANGWSVIDDQATTADYISTNTAAQTNAHGMGTTTSTNAIIQGIQIIAQARHNNATNVSRLRLGYNDTVGNVDADYDPYLTTNFYPLVHIWTYNTRTFAKFTKAQVDSMNLRITSVA